LIVRGIEVAIAQNAGGLLMIQNRPASLKGSLISTSGFWEE